MPRKAASIRFWFMLLAVALLGLWEPALWFFAFGFFFPGCACCGTDCGATCNGGSAPDELVLTLSGIAAGTCSGGDCTTLNGTYVSEFFDTVSNICRYRGIGGFIVCGGSTNYVLNEIQIGQVQGVGTFRVTMNIATAGSPNSGFTSDFLGAFPLDCSAIWPVDCPNIISDGLCDLTGATCTVDV